MYAPLVTRLPSYSATVDAVSTKYCEQIMAWPDVRQWLADAMREPEQIEALEVDMDF